MIERCRDTYPVRLMCRCLKVSPSGYYGWQRRVPSTRSQANAKLLSKIRGIHRESDGVYGSPRIWEELQYQGESCGLNRVARLMQHNGLQGIPQKRQWKKKTSGERPVGIKNHLKREFDAEQPNTKWVTDITYIRTGEGFLYLVVVLDLYSRLVGWSMSHLQDRQLVLQAVLMAVWQRRDRSPVILHSDRGCQFTSHEYQQFLKGHGLVCSMSAVGSCADNAVAESFFGILKRERVRRRKYLTRGEARADIFDYIERVYNPAKRRKLERTKVGKSPLTQLSGESG